MRLAFAQRKLSAARMRRPDGETRHLAKTRMP